MTCSRTMSCVAAEKLLRTISLCKPAYLRRKAQALRRSKSLNPCAICETFKPRYDGVCVSHVAIFHDRMLNPYDEYFKASSAYCVNGQELSHALGVGDPVYQVNSI